MAPRRELLVLPGGLARDGGETVFLTDHDGGIVAVDATDGQVRWTNATAAKPLAPTPTGLLALKGGVGGFRLALLDAGTGREVRETEPVELPELRDVPTGSDHAGERTYFKTRVRLEEGVVIVRWSAGRHLPIGGACPDHRILDAYNRHRTGVVRVALDPWEMEALPDDRELASRESSGMLPIGELPVGVRETARRQRWECGRVVGERAYGLAHELTDRVGSRALQVHFVEAVDLRTSRLLWRRPFGPTMRDFGPPPP